MVQVKFSLCENPGASNPQSGLPRLPQTLGFYSRNLYNLFMEQQRVSTFNRGLKLDPRKHATEGKPVEAAPFPKQVVIPIHQHFGAANKAIVAVGGRVRRGQKIAEGAAPGLMTVPVHASISGVVKRIEPRLQSNNNDGACIIIEADENTGEDDVEFMAPLDPFTCTKEDALGRIREAGITGMGGAGFPAHIKLNPPPEKTIDLVIADGAECEPYLTTDEAVIAEKPNLLVTGLAIIMKITGVKKAIIGMEDNKASLVPLLEREIALNDFIQNSGRKVSVGLCKTLYPQGGEKMLIKALTGRETPSGGLPMDCGCIVQNVGTLAAIAEAFTLGKPLIDRELTVSGGACKTPKNIRVPIGTVLSDLPGNFLAVDYDHLRKIIFGGPMMGNAVHTINIPIQKTTSGVILMTAQETRAEFEGACIRCGRCIRNCPCRLSPVLMNAALEAGDTDEAVRTGLMDCIECGSCSFICPARIKLVQRFRVGKQRLRLMKSIAQQAIKVTAAVESKAAGDSAGQNPVRGKV